MTGTVFAILAMFLFINRLFKLIFFHIHRIFSIDRIFPIDRILSIDRYFSINRIISINRIFAINRIFFILAYSEKKKIQKNRQPYSLMPGPSMAVRPPQEQPLQYRIDRIFIIIRNISIIRIFIISFIYTYKNCHLIEIFILWKYLIEISLLK